MKANRSFGRYAAMPTYRILKPMKLALTAAIFTVGATALPPVKHADAAGVQVNLPVFALMLAPEGD